MKNTLTPILKKVRQMRNETMKKRLTDFYHKNVNHIKDKKQQKWKNYENNNKEDFCLK